MLKRREECDTYLTHFCRHHCTRDSLVKRQNIRSFQPTLWVSSAADIDCQSTSTADESQCWLKGPYTLSFHRALSASLHLQLMKATVLAESSLHFIFPPGSLQYSDVYRHESGRFQVLPFFLTFFIISLCQPRRSRGNVLTLRSKVRRFKPD